MSENANLANEQGLSQREIEILTLVAEGRTTLEIAERLGIHHDSVQSHLRDSFKKIGVPNRLQAILWVANNL
jgi:LuxR family transcriptional regulator of csgAB operon